MKSRVGRLLVLLSTFQAVLAFSPLTALAQESFALAPVPGVSTASVLADRWTQLVRSHEPGRFDAAAERVLELSQRELAVILDAVHRGRVMVDRREVETVLAEAAVLHTEVAVAQMRGAERADRASTGGVAYLHFGMATELVKVLSSRPSTESFVRAWFLAVASVLSFYGEVNLTPAFLDSALARFSSDPDLLLLAGAARELRASQRVQDATDLGGTLGRVGSVSENLRLAEAFYRRAAASVPGRVEARVRLGRVLRLAGRPAEALVELETAARELEALHRDGATVDRAVPYFLLLFLGEAHQALGRVDAARREYAKAAAICQGAGSAWLNLSRLEFQNDNKAAAVAAITRMSQPGLPDDDPWRNYQSSGIGRNPEAMMAALADAIPRR